MQLHIYYGDFGLENAFPLPYLQFQGLLMREKQLECSEATSVSPDEKLTRPKFSVSLTTLVYKDISACCCSISMRILLAPVNCTYERDLYWSLNHLLDYSVHAYLGTKKNHPGPK